MHRRSVPVVVLAALAVLVVLGGVVVPDATAAQPEQATTTTIGPEDSPGIIPEPNQGVEPRDAGDRGGALQTLLFVLIVGATITIGGLVVRQSRRARAERGF